MLINGVYDSDIKQPARSEGLLNIIKPFVNFIVYSTADVHVNMPEDTLEFMRTNNVMISSRHVGLAETVIAPTVFYRLGLPVPYSVIGDNLVKGTVVVNFLKNLGLVFSERTSSDVYSAVIDSRSKMASVLQDGNNIAFYPTPGRSKNGLTVSFQASPFQVAIQLDTPIIPQSPGYFTYPEEYHFIEHVHRNKRKAQKRGYTVQLLHMPHLVLSHKGDVFMNYGKPIIPSEYFGGQVPSDKIAEYSKLLADHVRKECLYLTPITQRHIVAFASEQPGYLKDNIAEVLQSLEPYSDRFTFKFPSDCKDGDISLDDKIDILIHDADLKGKHQKLVQMYGNEIKHYIEGMYGRKFQDNT